MNSACETPSPMKRPPTASLTSDVATRGDLSWSRRPSKHNEVCRSARRFKSATYASGAWLAA